MNLCAPLHGKEVVIRIRTTLTTVSHYRADCDTEPASSYVSSSDADHLANRDDFLFVFQTEGKPCSIHMRCMCRGSALSSGNHYGGGTGPIWLDNLDCNTGNEMSITECQHRGWGVHNCTHDHDVSIICDTGKLPEKKLITPLHISTLNHRLRVSASTVLKTTGWR